MANLTFAVCVRLRVRSHVSVCIRVLRNTSLLPLKVGFLDTPPVKIQTEIRVYVRVYERVHVLVRARKGVCVYIRIKTGRKLFFLS